MRPSQQFSIRKEAILVFCNLISTSDRRLDIEHVSKLDGFIENFCSALEIQDANVLIEVLEALDVLLGLDALIPLWDDDKISFQIDIAGGLD